MTIQNGNLTMGSGTLSAGTVSAYGVVRANTASITNTLSAGTINVRTINVSNTPSFNITGNASSSTNLQGYDPSRFLTNDLSGATNLPMSGVTGLGALLSLSTNMAILQHRTNSSGGQGTAYSYVNRIINTKISDPSGMVTLSTSNTFRLGPGVFFIRAITEIYNIGRAASRFYCWTTNGAPVDGYGMNIFTTGNNSSGRSHVEMLMYCPSNMEWGLQSATGANGAATDFGVDAMNYFRTNTWYTNIFVTVTIQKLGN